ncbi:hypothetical protein MN086_10665 [Sulfurovum sp. XGS-02]|uniref:hypothetical protein n=1 Tax=Sulfurovum sp. XGS-02 TaxID=2925411 RepID=UPI002059DC5F|nr:hypothetical protein [Sulfurovum sp. XGS-02]UPT77496.1 hypothetical protein MN086_10665 [Sulfurovum sp. XGS-02]
MTESLKIMISKDNIDFLNHKCEQLAFHIMSTTDAHYEMWKEDNDYEESLEEKAYFKRQRDGLKILQKALSNPDKYQRDLQEILDEINERKALISKRQPLDKEEYELDIEINSLEWDISECNSKIKLNLKYLKDRNFLQKMFNSNEEKVDILNQTLRSEIRQAEQLMKVKKRQLTSIREKQEEINSQILKNIWRF